MTKCTMMRSIALLPLAFFLLAASAQPHRGHDSHPVCIIGAGPAGLAAAGRLQAKGIDAIVFDKQDEVGGKCQAWYDEKGIFHPLGAAFFSNATYPETIKILNQTHVPIEPFALAGTRQVFRYNYTNGLIQANPAPPPSVLAAVEAEIPRYTQLWTQRFQPIRVTNYKNGVPDEFSVSGAEWFRRNNLTVLASLLVNPVALYGYGDINIVPALYILQYFTPDILTAFIGLHSVYYMDFHKMFVEYARQNLTSTRIKTSSEVRSIDRSCRNPIVSYTTTPNQKQGGRRGGGRGGAQVQWTQQTCSSIILAFPPSLANLKRVGLTLTESESTLFANITTHQYYSSAVNLALPFGVSYIANNTSPSTPPPNAGEPVAVLHLSPRSNVSVAWSWGPDLPAGAFQPESTARRLLVQSLAKINKDPRRPNDTLLPFTDPDDVKAFRKWDYFPHFTTEALRAGAYARLGRLQGEGKTYYASGLSGMEIVEWALRGGYDVVDRYF